MVMNNIFGAICGYQPLYSGNVMISHFWQTYVVCSQLLRVIWLSVTIKWLHVLINHVLTVIYGHQPLIRVACDDQPLLEAIHGYQSLSEGYMC